MQLLCTRPGCSRPQNTFADLDEPGVLKSTRQKFCTNCGMPLILADRYLPDKLLGQGGFGAAYRARDRYTPGMRQCVVKQFKPPAHLNATQLQLAHGLFVREAEVLEQLGQEHLQIPDLYAFFDLDVPSSTDGASETYFYIVQEFIDGQDLEQELRQRGAFSEAEVREVLKSMLEVLRFVHESDTIHRDIKPSNIMRSRKGRLYLLDFGAIKYATTQTGNPPSASTSIFSPGYAPPEQMAGREVFFSTDLYSLAVTCLELLTGQPPQDLYHSATNRWQWQDHVRVSDSLARVLNKMLQSAPSDRYWSAAEVLLALDPQRSSHQVMPPPQAPAQTPPPPPVPPPISPPKPRPVPPIASSARSRRSSLELLGGAAFTGFEAGLAAVTIHDVLPRLLFWQMGVGVLIVTLLLLILQVRRTIERLDLILIAGLTIAAVSWLKPTLPYWWLLAIVAALVTVAVTAFFSLIYRLLARLF